MSPSHEILPGAAATDFSRNNSVQMLLQDTWHPKQAWSSLLFKAMMRCLLRSCGTCLLPQQSCQVSPSSRGDEAGVQQVIAIHSTE